MDALVAVEPVFGNAHQIAQALARGLGPRVHARVIDVAEAVGRGADLVERADELVVGGPTYAFGMSRLSARRAAAERSER